MKKIYLTSLSMLLLCLVTISAFAQKTVSGTVTDNAGMPIAGVSILQKGSANGTSSSSEGKYSLSVPPNSTIIFKYLGYITREIALGNNSVLNVTLQDDAKVLGDVVITGLGEQRKTRNLGYSLTSINGDQIRATNTTNPISALQGLVPGMMVQPGQGGPQSSPKFQIRGASSLYGSENTPLIVVDGIMLSDDVVVPSRGGDQDFGNVLKNINSDDIESISVLKGGSVTALYGSRATNGVILITTKKGYSQKGLGISFSHDETFDKAYALPDMQKEYGSGFTMTDFVKAPNGMNQINPASYGFSFGPKLDGSTILDADGQRQITNSVLNNPLTLYQLGRYINSNIAMQGGNEKTTFRFSYSNNYSNGVSPLNKLNRNTFNFRGTQRLANAVTLDATVSYANTKGFNPQLLSGDNSLIYGLTWGYPTNYDLGYWSQNYLDPVKGGRSANDPFGTNSLFFRMNQNSQVQNENNLRGSLNAKVDFTKWLQFEANVGLNWYNTARDTKELGQDVNFAGGYFGADVRNVIDSRYRGSFNLKHKISDFDLFLQLGSELVRSQTKGSIYNTNGGLRVPKQYRISNSINTPTIREYAGNVYQNFATYAQGSIGYKDWLTLNIYGRNEWNSTLVYSNGTGNYSYFYPGADLAWVITDAVKLPEVFSYAKLRASYSITGGGTSVYRANTGYYVKNGNYVPISGSEIEQYGFDSSTLGNTDLKPVRTYSQEVGLELKMLKNRLGLDFTAYKKNSKNQIVGLAVPSESGVSSALINSGDVQDMGIEFILSGTPIKTKTFSWDTYFNYTRNRTKIISLAPGVTTVQLEGGDGIRTIARVGGEYSTMVAAYGYAKYQARDAQGNPIDNPNNGKKVLSVSGSGGAFYTRAANYANGLEPESTIGSTLPKFYGSVRNVFNYKSVSLSALVDAKFGGYVFSDTYYYGSQTGNLANTLYGRDVASGGVPYTENGVQQIGVVLDGVFPDGTIINGVNVGGMTHQQTIDKGLRIPTQTYRYYNNSNGWANGIRERGAFKSSWVAVRDITLSYDLPKSLVSRIKMNGVRLNLSARNVGFLYNNAPDNVNVNDFTSTGAGGAFLGGGTPYVRTFAFGINGSF
ncbi:SusC/RagA family TonB-linked outer membrane protein [Pedobacter jeongneungensis]|uniref:SusC/RagA family TonB-linked outer membrane protein n=1 Tax=Pedobacter jeongneungensis TaxID=947309 RepID=A0ABP8BNJ0_9SPHI